MPSPVHNCTYSGEECRWVTEGGAGEKWSQEKEGEKVPRVEGDG